ncbi:MAG TPA: signal peptidase I [Opitutaceae bacterium]|nr:signal peptidase I [Opitutaceae bacterium]
MKRIFSHGLLLVLVLGLGTALQGRDLPAADSLSDARALAAAHPGLKIMRVRGESMEPFFGDGAVVVVRTVSFLRLRPGEVVVYRNRFGEVIAHRLVAAESGGWRVKGEANDAPDSTRVTAGNLMGVVYATFNVAAPMSPALEAVDVALAAPAR